ncbi:MAG: O-antigen ligase family protein, partial [Anaerolineales bacterium]|nr:O-antigen ligase family protein [Anaerolineales bacterium]
MNKILSPLPHIQSKEVKQLLYQLLFACAAVGLGLLVARLIVVDNWQIAAVIIFSIPAAFILQRYPFLAIVVWLLLTPFLMRSGTSSSTMRQVYWVIHRFLPVLTLVAILLPSALGLSRRSLPRLGFPEWMMAGYVLVSITSILLFNNDPRATLYLFYDRVIVPMFLYLIARLSRPDERKIHWLFPVMLFIVWSQSIIGVLSEFSPGVLPKQWVDYESRRTIGTLVNSYTYVIALILSSFFVFHYGMQSPSKIIRNAAVLTLLIASYGIFISFSRTGWLAGILAILGLAAIYPRVMTRLGLVVLPLVFLAAGLFFQKQVAWAHERLTSEQAENSALSRLPVYAAGFNMFSAKPIGGWGYGNFDNYDRQFQVYQFLNITKYNAKDHASHNFFLTIAAEQGLSGIILFTAPLLYWFIQTLKRFPQLPKNGFWSRKILAVFWLALLSHIVIYSFTNMRTVFALGAFWLGIGFVARFLDAHQPE